MSDSAESRPFPVREALATAARGDSAPAQARSVKRLHAWLLVLVFAAAFLTANRAAYRGYFQDDELDNLSWTVALAPREYLEALLSPRFFPNNFRPAGHLYFHLMGRAFGLNFPPYLTPLHALHIANVALVWLISRRLGAGAFAASAAAVFFGFHMAAFDIYWKPMYVFDLLCAFFSLLSFLLYTRNRGILSFVAFWLAYKSKELAIVLPLVLAAWEHWFGSGQWKRLLPFFAVSLLFGIQGWLLNPHPDGEYTFRLSGGALWTTGRYYASRILLLPFAGLVLVPLALWFGNRRARLGILAMLLFFAPLAFLPGRLYAAYCYLPLAGLATAVSGLAAPKRKAAVVALLSFWLFWNYVHLRLYSRHALEIAAGNRAYVSALVPLARSSPGLTTFLYDGAPAALRFWGIAGALRYLYGREITLRSFEDAGPALAGESTAVLTWDAPGRRLLISFPGGGQPDASYIRMDGEAPVSQLGEGWYSLEGGFRWIQPRASARLRRPADARAFELIIQIPPAQIQELGRVELALLLDGRLLQQTEFRGPGRRAALFPLAPGPPGAASIEIRVS
ncbi:MAG: hypothetical protein FJW37_06945, partial [Acidobacteria bacterium]|nr:hypothetical protein [Acidobacteriota bacterium]